MLERREMNKGRRLWYSVQGTHASCSVTDVVFRTMIVGFTGTGNRSTDEIRTDRLKPMSECPLMMDAQNEKHCHNASAGLYGSRLCSIMRPKTSTGKVLACAGSAQIHERKDQWVSQCPSSPNAHPRRAHQKPNCCYF